MIQRHLPEEQKLLDVPAENLVISIPKIRLEQSVPLCVAFKERGVSEKLLVMEDVNQDFGYIHYETVIK